MNHWFAASVMLACWGGALAPEVRAASYPLLNGQTVSGDPVAFNEVGIILKLPDGSMAPRVAWTNFTQDALKELNKISKAAPFVDALIELPESSKPKLDEVIELRPVPRLPRPAEDASLFAMFSSSMGLLVLFLLWGANLYAAFEIAIFRNYPPLLVSGISAVVPILGPIVFLCLPTRVYTAHVPERSATAEHAPEWGAKFGDNKRPHGAPAQAQASGGPEEAALPATTTYQRGQTTFNRRFFETILGGFHGASPTEAAKGMIFEVKTGRAKHLGHRIIRVTPAELQFQANSGHGTEDVNVTFSDISEIIVRHKDT